MAEKKIQKSSLRSAFWRWYHGNLMLFSHQHMQTFPFLVAMIKPIKDLYSGADEVHAALTTYEGFFNVEPQLGTIIVGICCGLEESRANGVDEIDEEMINSVRVGLMGPLAGIGDSLIPGTYIPILLSIALGLASGGSMLGPIFYIVTYISTMTAFQYFIFMKGYELGGKAVDVIVGEQANVIKDSIIMLGMIVVGAVAGSWVNVTTALSFKNSNGDVFLNLQGVFDGVLPGILSLLTVLFAWWLMTKRKMQPTTVMLIFLALALIGVVVGFFNPGVNY